MKLTDLIGYAASASFGALVLFLLRWIRFRPKDKIDVDKVRADNLKTSAEAQEIRAKADVLITDGALRIVERLSTDLDEARAEIDKLISIVADLKALHEKHKAEYQLEAVALRDKLLEAKNLAELKKKHCIDIRVRIGQLQDLLKLRQQGLTQEQLEEVIKNLNDLKNQEL